MAFIIRPDGDTDLTNAQIVAESTLPQTIGSLTAGAYEVGRITWAASPVTVTDPVVSADAFVTNGSHFLDTANAPTNTTVVEFEVRMKLPTAVTFATAMGQISATRIEVSTSNAPRILVEDGAGVTANGLSTTSFLNVPPFTVGQTSTLNVLIDYEAAEATVTLDGTSQTIAFSGTQTTIYAQDYRKLIFGGNDAGLALLPADAEVEYFKVWLTTSGTRTLRKEISIAAQGSIAGINADPWHAGGDVTATA